MSWHQVAERTGLSRSRAHTLLREERARLAYADGQPSTSHLTQQPAGRTFPPSA